MTSDAVVPRQYEFSGRQVDVFFDADFSLLKEKLSREKTVFITDENVFAAHQDKFIGWQLIIIKAGEFFKNQQAVDTIIEQLIALHADRQSFIVGVGGGVVTDITGFVASIYMRGVKFAFVPTTVLAMVDASIGGKNGIDVGVYKNLVGVINQPDFLWYDYSFLRTLPFQEWVNGFAEIIKHACIKDAPLFEYLEHHTVNDFQVSAEEIGELIRRNVAIKLDIVVRDERETGERKLLNFGHTIGHAIENTSRLPHGHAISIGMVAACRISEAIAGFDAAATTRVTRLLQQYELPVTFLADSTQTWEILLHDKKRRGNALSFVVLNTIGKAAIQSIPLDQLHQIFNSLQ